jgi:flagellar hook-basal body complex protein FliE
MSSINNINSLIKTNFTTNSLEVKKADQNLADSFGETIKGVVEKLNAQQIGAEKETVKAVVGETPDLHQTIVALQTAEMKLQFALQVRNKLLNAYEEIMRMQV